MTSTVIPITRSVDDRVVQKLFAKFSSHYGSLWSSRLGVSGDWLACEKDWRDGLCDFSFEHLKGAVKKALVLYADYPPTLGQLIQLCIKESGAPSIDEVISMMINREFNHPLVKMIYDKIGHWALTNGKEQEIQSKTKEHYVECLADFQLNTKQHWEILALCNTQPKSLPKQDKIPSEQERKGFKERLSEYQQKLKAEKINCETETYREFDEQAITPTNRMFDQKTYEDYRNYLLSITEEKTITLPVSYMYDRRRFISAKEQPELLRMAGYNPTPQGINERASKDSYGTQKVYKNWTG